MKTHLRRFVLAPWAVVDPTFVIPGRGTVADVLAGLSDDSEVVELPGDSSWSGERGS